MYEDSTKRVYTVSVRFDRRPKAFAPPTPQQRSGSTLRKVALPEHVHVFETNELVTFAADREVMIEIWRVRPTTELFARLDKHFQWLVERRPRVAALSVIECHDTPDAAAREAGAALIKRYAQQLVGVGFVIEGSSFKHTVIRFSLTTIDLLSSSNVPQPVFDRVDAACRWLCDLLPTATRVERSNAVNALRDLPP